MELFLKNIGKIGETSVRLDGITVIAGENDTGKSTVSRALFFIFNSFYRIEEQIEKERKESLSTIFEPLMSKTERLISVEKFNVRYRHIAAMISDIIRDADKYKNDSELLCNDIMTLYPYAERAMVEKIVPELIELLSVSDDEIFCSILEKNLNAEFNNQVQNFYNKQNSEIRLELEDISIALSLSNGYIAEVTGREEGIGLYKTACYLDNPLIIDSNIFLLSYAKNYHQEFLSKCLFNKENDANIVDKIITNKKLERVYAMISQVCSGKMVKMNSFEMGYQTKPGGEILNIKNLSSGLKTFVILKTLLLNGSIEAGSVVLLDEPEIHLHPEWQLLLAEIIVLLHKEFDLYILLNTHSHYFLDAIEVYSKKHGVVDKCRYYLASLDGNFATMTDVTGNTEAIYQKLARPFQRLENERYHNEN